MNRKQRKSITILIMGVLLISLVTGHSIQPVAMASDEVTFTASNFSQLLSALNDAEDGDVIGITGRIDQFSSANIGDENKHITIRRMNSSSFLRIQAEAIYQNITFDGNGIDSIAAFVMTNGNVTFQNVTFHNSLTTTANGGAAYVIHQDATFTNCTFDNNAGVEGGHIYLDNSANVTIENSILKNGYAISNGGAIKNSVNTATANVISSIITGNSAGEYGGGITNYGDMTITGSKVYDNSSPVGNDIANSNNATLNLTDSLEELVELFKDDGIVPMDWVNDYDAEQGIVLPEEIDPSEPYSLLKLDYEIPPTEVILDPESLGVAGDEKITGLESGKYYQVTMDDVISYVKADGTLTTDEVEAEPLLGTEIVGLTNGMTYRVEEYTPPVEEEPEEPGDDEEEPQDPIDDEEPPIEEPGGEEPIDEEPNDETPGDEEQEQEDNDQEEQEDETEETEETETPSESNVDQVSSQEQSSSSSSTSRSTTDIAEINPSSSSTVNNYFTHQTPSNAPHSLPVAQVGSTNPTSPQAPVTQEQTIKIDAASLIPDGVKVQEDANGITINVNVNVGSEGNGEAVQAQVQPDNGIPLVDVVKICLLFGIFICVFKRPERK